MFNKIANALQEAIEIEKENNKMKLKLELNYSELTDLNNSEMSQTIIDMAHAMVDEALERRTEATKCVVTMDSDKE